MIKDNCVGRLRQQSALCECNRPVVVVSKDPDVSKVLRTFKVVCFYPDPLDAKNGIMDPVFKIELASLE